MTTRFLRWLLLAAILPVAPSLLAQSVEEINIPVANARPFWLSAASDGALWFTMPGARSVGRITLQKVMWGFGTQGLPYFAAAGVDGSVWFTTAGSSALGLFRTNGSVGRFAGNSDGSALQGIAANGSSVWLTTGSGKVVQLTLAGAIAREVTVPANGGPAPSLSGIAISSDGLAWFADQRAGAPRIGRIVFVSGVPTVLFVNIAADSIPFAMTAGANGAVWFTDRRGRVVRITREGAVTTIALSPQSDPLQITRAADGAIWFTESGSNAVGRIDATTLALTELDIPTPNGRPSGIAQGADGAIWVTEQGTNKIARIGASSPGADLFVTIAGPDLLKTTVAGADGIYTVTVRNIGADLAGDVNLSVDFGSLGTTKVELTSQGVCEKADDNGGMTCSLQSIPSGGVATVRFARVFFGFTNSDAIIAASATTSSGERNPGNDRASLRVNRVDCDHLDNCVLLDHLATAICESRVPLAVPPRSASSSSPAPRWKRSLANELGIDLEVFYKLRDDVFSRTAAGRRYTEIYYANGREIAGLYFRNPSEGAQSLDAIRAWQEPLRALVEGRGSSATITNAQIVALQTVLDNLKRLGSAALRRVIEREESKLQIQSLVGLTMDQALARHTATVPLTVTLPAAASLHGIPPAFFHSDVRVFNPAPAPVEVTARYRCFSGSCGVGSKTFSLAAGEMRVFADMVAQELGVPESGGAIEFEGEVIVDSRLYTPEADKPTTGMYVPALTASSAYAESVLTSLSHSADGSRGFRTNAGVYNGNDVALDVTFVLHDRSGAEIGRVTRSVPARTPVQVNNIFGVVGATGDFDGAYGVVRADGVYELFAYASVIDNRSQDLIFVLGRNRKRSALTTSTLAAAASLHGNPPAFFHSDVTVFNPSPTERAPVIARYRCFLGACPAGATTTLEVEPGQVRIFEDAVVALFGAPESGGAIEFSGPVLVDSRLYTPSRPDPSSGMYIPAAEDQEAHAESVLLSLASSPEFRTNAGAYNPNPIALDVTFTLFDPAGQRLGEVTRRVPPRTPVQVNNIFTVAGVTASVPNAYCVVRADGIHKLFAFASVIDGRSQDPIFIRGNRRGGL